MQDSSDKIVGASEGYSNHSCDYLANDRKAHHPGFVVIDVFFLLCDLCCERIYDKRGSQRRRWKWTQIEQH